MNKKIFKGQRIRLLIMIILLGISCCGLVACVVLSIWGITGIANVVVPPPGKGAKAEKGYQVCGPIIEALREYHIVEGEYPQKLESLSPTYMADVPSEVNGFPILYQTTQESYSLEFRYTGPGMNICTYNPESNWHCHGYY